MQFRLQAAAWVILALAGQVSILMSTEAGRLVRYQHFRPGAAALAILAVQAMLVAAGLWGQRRRLGGFSRWPAVGAVALFLLAAAAAPSREMQAYGRELALAFGAQAIQLGNAVLAGLSAGAGVSRVREWIQTRSFRVTAAVWVLCAAGLLCIFSYQRHPHVPDEVSYLYQARYLASGVLAMPSPPVPRAFDLDLMTYTADGWYSPMLPGWSFALAAGVKLGWPWLLNPVLAAVCILLAAEVLSRLYSRAIAGWAVLLLATSPWFLFLAMSYMSHILSLACALAAALAAQRHRFFLAGAVMGVLFWVRPLEFVEVAVVAGVATLLSQGGVRGTLLLCCGAASTTWIHLLYNRLLTGQATYFPVMQYFDRYYAPGVNDLGFGANRGLNWAIDPFPGHGLADAAVNTLLNLSAVNVELLGWGAGSLALAVLLVAFGRLCRADCLMLGVIGSVAAGSAFYWFSGGPDFGARYWFLMIVPLMALSARAIESANGAEGRSVQAGALVLTGLSLALFVPWRAVDKYHHYLNMRPDVHELAAEHGFGRSLVLVRGKRFPDYASAATYNPIDLSSPVPIYVWDRDEPTRREALAAFAGRPVWVLEGPSLTGGAYRLVERPR